MKKSLLLIIAMSCLMACKKESNNTTKNSGTVLLSKITDNTPKDDQFGQTVAEFTYNGKQLVKAVQYDSPTKFQTDIFTYDSNGKLTGSTISYSKDGVTTPGGLIGDVRSTVTYNGNNIAEIKFYLANNVLDQDVVVTYQNNNLTSWSNTYNNQYSGFRTVTTSQTYQYNSSNNNTSSVYGGFTTTNTSFDSKNNLFKAFPLWVYFCSNVGVYYFYGSETPGANNVLTSNLNDLYQYQYNSYDYPSMISSLPNNGSVQYSFKYEYIQAN